MQTQEPPTRGHRRKHANEQDETLAMDKLWEWARTWMEKLKPYNDYFEFIDSKIEKENPSSDYVTKKEKELEIMGKLGDHIAEALLKSSNCELMARANGWNYIRCGDYYVMIPSSVSEVKEEDHEKILKFYEKIDGKLEIKYRHPDLMYIKVFSGEEIKANKLKEALGLLTEPYITVDIMPPWLDIDFRTHEYERLWGSLSYLQDSDTIKWRGRDGDDEAKNSAAQDVLEHLHELDKAMAGLLQVMEIGLKGVIESV